MGADVVFCLPHAGGGMHQYLSWATAFGGVLDWEPVEYPGHFTRDEEPCYDTFEDAVTDLADHIATRADGRRIGIFGHSLGATLAYEVGRRLTACSKAELDAVVISSSAPPSCAGAIRQRYFELDDEELMEHLQRLDDTEARSPVWHALVADILPLIRSDYRLHHSYRPDPAASINVPLHVCAGIREPIGKDQLLGWQRHGSASVKFYWFPGGHFYWRPQVKCITDVLRELFASPESGAPYTGTRTSACRY